MGLKLKNVHLELNGGHVHLVNQDCIAGMPHYVEAKSIDVVVTSPPYNLGIDYGTHDDNQPRDKYLEWTDQWMQGVHNSLADDGSFFLNVGGKPTDPWVPYDVLNVARKYFTLQNQFIWVKSISIDARYLSNYVADVMKRTLGKIDFPWKKKEWADFPIDPLSIGHYKPLNTGRFVNECWEFVFHLTKNGKVPVDRLALGVPFTDKSNMSRGSRGENGDIRCRGNVWYVPYTTIQSRRGQRPHPASFPARLARHCIKLHGIDRCRVVMDPFMGIGNTAAAAASLGMTTWGFEIDEDYLASSMELIPQLVENYNV